MRDAALARASRLDDAGRAVLAAAATNGLPVDAITEVSVLDPYFYVGA